VEVHPSPDVATGEDEAGGWETPQADLEGIFPPPFQQGRVSTLCGEEGGGTRNGNQGDVGHDLGVSQRNSRVMEKTDSRLYLSNTRASVLM